MLGGGPVDHKLRSPTTASISVHQASTCIATAIPGVLIQRSHQSGGALGRRAIPDGHVCGWGRRKERVLGGFLLEGVSGRTLPGGGAARGGKVLLAHSEKDARYMEMCRLERG